MKDHQLIRQLAITLCIYRTIEELKAEWGNWQFGCRGCIYRTIEELKGLTQGFFSGAIISIYRTIEELKEVIDICKVGIA